MRRLQAALRLDAEFREPATEDKDLRRPRGEVANFIDFERRFARIEA
jgi:hypothetical protein